MRKYLDCRNTGGIIEQPEWQPHYWVNVECPDTDDMELLLGDLKIPRDFIVSVDDPDERPRMEHDRGWTMTVIRIPVREPGDDICPFTTVPMGIMVNNEIVVTVCNHRTELVPDLIEHTRERMISINTDSDLMLRLLYSSTYWFLKYLKEINDHVTTASRGMRTEINNDALFTLMDIQKTLVYFNTSIRGNELLLDRIRKVYNGQYNVELLDNIEVEIKQAANTVDVYDDILKAMMDSYASVISNNVNNVMKKMTGVSIVLMLPTLIASFYGMNVKIGVSSDAWAFWVIVVSSFALSIVLYFILKRIRWL